MELSFIIMKIKALLVKVCPTSCARLIPEAWLGSERRVEDIIGGFTKAIWELETLAEDKILEQGEIQKEMEELERDKADAVDQQIRAENIALNISKILT